MCILAHPDDESLGTGGILAKYASDGIETYLLMATRGERGWAGDEKEYPGPDALGRIREAELKAAAKVLGLQDVTFLDYRDGEVDRADPGEIVAKIARHLRRIRPDVVVTFDPFGSYGHPDHIGICQFATAAIMAAGNPSFDAMQHLPSHQVSKLYYMVEIKEMVGTYQEVFGDLVMKVDGMDRRAPGWEQWAITTRIDTAAHWQQVWQAISCHKSQLSDYAALADLSTEQHKNLWESQTYYRVFSLVNGGRRVERDLFEGLR
jgi:LmbE family N-acetylglucosaminyl deacetylase